MNSFGRALRLALRHRVTFVASVLTALLVGGLWGGNITALYPFVVIAGRNQSLQDWIAEEIQKSRANVRQWTQARSEAEKDLAAPDEARKKQAAARLAQAEARLEAEQNTLARYEWVRPWIDDYLPRAPFRTLLLFLGLVLLGTLVKDLFLVANNLLVARLANLGGLELQRLFFARTLRMDVATFGNEGTSDLMSRFTNDMQALVTGMNILFGKLVREPLKMAACLIGAALICWRLLVLSLVIAPLAALLIRALARTLKRANRRAMEEMAQLYNTLAETFQGIKIVKAFTMERQERRRFQRVCKKYFQKSMRIAGWDALSKPVIEVMGMLIICLAMLAGAYLVLQGETHLLGIRMSARPLTIESLLVFFGLLAGAADPARKLSDVFTQLQAGAAAADRIYALLDREPQVRDPARPRPLGRHSKSLVFEGVHFAYQPGHPVLCDINLEIRFGETLGIVGPSGCGKTTLANLIPRFADPTEGVIRLDGIPLPEVRLRDLRRQIGLVTQDPLLFDDTVLANIRYGSPWATEAEVVEAARQAHAHRFIETELPEGYHTVVGLMGGQLSGGQRQRIALARAILRNPSILILDEATSQVDLESEKLIQKVLERFMRGRTTVIITHRLGALALADRIAVVQDGRLADVGTHHELLGRCDFYRRLYEIQFDELRQSA
ncbi:MAG: ABC transporter ATP-binding protein/permease [Thermoguttaceae bacterium]|jgi:ATP-binding cassette subfamily B protein/subfamily B ATP-binding cassette protein MsbA|nr:ABC transporter ATP-binding protein/permease [Thermoguttaceae bacterium]